MATGIFQKPCPACATLLPREALECECGYLFDSDEPSADESQQLIQEQLFETYLTARVQQALADLEAERTKLAATPTDIHQAHAVLQRVQTLQRHRQQLLAQQDKVAALRARATDMPTEFRATQAARAAEIVERNAVVVCSRCGAAIPADGGACACGATDLLRQDTAPPAVTAKTTKPTKP